MKQQSTPHGNVLVFTSSATIDAFLERDPTNCSGAPLTRPPQSQSVLANDDSPTHRGFYDGANQRANDRDRFAAGSPDRAQYDHGYDLGCSHAGGVRDALLALPRAGNPNNARKEPDAWRAYDDGWLEGDADIQWLRANPHVEAPRWVCR